MNRLTFFSPEAFISEAMLGKKRKKRRQEYQEHSFVIREVFPPDSRLAIDLLRLMAAYNDMTNITDWMLSTRKPPAPSRVVAFARTRIRVSIQHRLFLAVMHESLVILDGMQGGEEFKKVVGFLSKEGRDSLRALRLTSSREKKWIRAQLAEGRNKAASHYDHDEFATALKDYIRLFPPKEPASSRFFLSRADRFYYLLPEQVRDMIVFGMKPDDDLDKLMKRMGDLLKETRELLSQFETFLSEVVLAYAEAKSIRGKFKCQHIYD